MGAGAGRMMVWRMRTRVPTRYAGLMSTRVILSVTLMAVVAVACGDDDDPPPPLRSFTLTFAGEVNGTPAACGATYADVGTPAGNYTLGDFRFYVHDVALVEAGTGVEYPLTLSQTPVWQDGNLALLDFEDGTGACGNGTPQTNDVVVGTAEDRTYDGVRFTLGVPFDLNHQDVAVAAAPLNLTALFWNWNAGYKYARIDGMTDGNTFRFHLGSTGCEMDDNEVVTGCANPNRVAVNLSGFDPDAQVIVADHGRILADTDTSTNAGTQPGCMANPMDTDCVDIFDKLGLPFMGNAASGEQNLFRVR